MARVVRWEVLYLDLHCIAAFLRRGCALLLFCFPSFGLLASLVSTTTLWGIERGNSDLVMFCLLFPVALWIPKLWSPIPILLGTALKLYPVFALGALLIQREFRLFAASLVAPVAILVYLWDQLAAIWSSIPVVCWMGYGFASLRFCLRAVPFWQVAGTFAMIGIAQGHSRPARCHYGRLRARSL
jgi:hypothetical protein